MIDFKIEFNDEEVEIGRPFRLLLAIFWSTLFVLNFIELNEIVESNTLNYSHLFDPIGIGLLELWFAISDFKKLFKK